MRLYSGSSVVGTHTPRSSLVDEGGFKWSRRSEKLMWRAIHMALLCYDDVILYCSQQVESSAVQQLSSLVQNVLQQALAIGKHTMDLLFKPRLITTKPFLASARRIRFNPVLNGYRRRNLARMRSMRKRLNILQGRRPFFTLHWRITQIIHRQYYRYSII